MAHHSYKSSLLSVEKSQQKNWIEERRIDCEQMTRDRPSFLKQLQQHREV